MLQRVYFSLNSPPHHCTANSYLSLWGELIWGHRTILHGPFDVQSPSTAQCESFFFFSCPRLLFHFTTYKGQWWISSSLTLQVAQGNVLVLKLA